MMGQQNLESVLQEGVGKKVNFCILCKDEKVADQVRTEVFSGSCIQDPRTCEEYFYADILLTRFSQVEGYVESFVGLFRRHKISSVIFLVEDGDPLEFLSEDLHMAAAAA